MHSHLLSHACRSPQPTSLLLLATAFNFIGRSTYRYIRCISAHISVEACALCSAQEFVKDPRFVVGDANRFDVEQGALGVFSVAFLEERVVLTCIELHTLG